MTIWVENGLWVVEGVDREGCEKKTIRATILLSSWIIADLNDFTLAEDFLFF